jgi:aspartate 1-decarboxylase
VHVDAGNRIVALGSDPAEPLPGAETTRGDIRGDMIRA